MLSSTAVFAVLPVRFWCLVTLSDKTLGMSKVGKTLLERGTPANNAASGKDSRSAGGNVGVISVRSGAERYDMILLMASKSESESESGSGSKFRFESEFVSECKLLVLSERAIGSK